MDILPDGTVGFKIQASFFLLNKTVFFFSCVNIFCHETQRMGGWQIFGAFSKKRTQRERQTLAWPVLAGFLPAFCRGKKLLGGDKFA